MKHLHMFSFLVVVGGRDTSTLAPGESRQSICFTHSSTHTFPCLPVQVFSNMGNAHLPEQPHRKMWDASGCLHSKRPCSASCDVPNPNLNPSSPKRSGHADNVCLMQTVQVPCSPRAGEWCSTPAQTLHRVSLGLSEWWSSFLLPSIKKKEKIRIMFLTDAILRWYNVLLSSLLASYDRATELDPSLHAHTTLASLELWLVPWVQVLPETQQGCSHKPSLFCTSKIRKVYKKNEIWTLFEMKMKYEHYSTFEGFVSIFFQ